ncbi:MAG: hypothetical protein ABJL54_00205 [Halioglobus sp.]
MISPRMLVIWLGGVSIIGALHWSMSEQPVELDPDAPGSYAVATDAPSATAEPASSSIDWQTKNAATAEPESVAIQKAPDGTTVVNIGADMDADDLYASVEESEPVNLGADMDADNSEFASDYEEPVDHGEPMDADAIAEDFSQSEAVQNIGPDLDVDYAYLDESSELKAPVNIGPDMDVPDDY